MEPSRELVTPEELAGQRLDRVLAQLLPEMTRSAIQRLIKDGQVLLDGRPAKASDKPAAGQRLAVSPAEARVLDLQPQDIPLDIVFEDEHLLVVNKPPDMVVHPAKSHQDGTLINALLAHTQLSARGDAVRPGIVHRLDQHTSGLLLVAKTDQAHAQLSWQVEAHEARREYQALVWGHPRPPEGTIRTGFGRHPQHRTMMAVRDEGRGREAVTHYSALEAYAWSWEAAAGERARRRQAALVACVLETGRTHQIRVHLQHLGCPIMHDPVYGDATRDADGPAELRGLLHALPGQALHAGRISFRHPATGAEMTLQATPPPGFAALLAWLRRHPAG